MTDIWTPGPVYLGEHKVWEEELSLFFASDLLMYMTHNNADVIREYVIPNLNIADMPLSKERLDALAGEDPIARAIAGRQKYLKRRSALKGVAMELVCASLMRYLDRCRQIIAHCKTEFGNPHSPAPSGNHPDISGLFPRTPRAQEFTVHMEVSAKRNMSLKKFREQLTWGYNHCVTTRDKYPGLIVYCLLINGAESYKNNRHHDLYRSFLKRHSDVALVCERFCGIDRQDVLRPHARANSPRVPRAAGSARCGHAIEDPDASPGRPDVDESVL